jgi:hypothetical protein
MRNDEAKFILSAYRPGGRDAHDPAMAPALAQAKNDPALSAWLARQQAHDAAVAAKLREVVPPAGLRDAILAGARVSGRGVGEVSGTGETSGADTASDSKKEVAVARKAWWVQPVWLAAAAAMALLLSLAAWRMAPVRGESFGEFAVNFVDKGFMLQKRGADVAALKAWLGEQRGPLPEALPAKFAELRALGCRTLSYRGQDVSLMCFEREGKEFHVFVARLENVGRSAEGTVPRMLDGVKNGYVAAEWADSKNRYVVVSDASLTALKGVL